MLNKKRKRNLVLVAALLLAGVGGVWVTYLDEPELSDRASAPAPGDLAPDHLQERLARLQQLRLPADGLALYQTLLREIPDVTSQVPCACCGESLTWCYEGGCPPS